MFFFFFFNDTATTEIYTSVHTLSLHDALPISTSLPALWTAGRRAGSPFSPSTYSFKYASVPRGSARPSRHATAGDPLLLRLQWVRATNRHEQSGLDEEVEP